jgi:hypothetical protein
MACVTTRPLTPEVFHCFLSLLTSEENLDSVKFRLEAGRLYVAAPLWTPELRETISSFLESAETALRLRQLRLKKEDLTLNEKSAQYLRLPGRSDLRSSDENR